MSGPDGRVCQRLQASQSDRASYPLFSLWPKKEARILERVSEPNRRFKSSSRRKQTDTNTDAVAVCAVGWRTERSKTRTWWLVSVRRPLHCTRAAWDWACCSWECSPTLQCAHSSSISSQLKTHSSSGTVWWRMCGWVSTQCCSVSPSFWLWFSHSGFPLPSSAHSKRQTHSRSLNRCTERSSTDCSVTDAWVSLSSCCSRTSSVSTWLRSVTWWLSLFRRTGYRAQERLWRSTWLRLK